jgi:branched-chain amino acid transport system substrate-binding protein
MQIGIGSSRTLRTAGVASALVAAALLASCVSASASGAATTTAGGTGSTPATNLASSAPGVTPTEIKIGSVSTLTGSIAADFSAFAPGMQAYFKMINAQGGINGRKVVLAYDLDDAGNPTTFTQLAHTLIQQDHVFAVAASTYWFTPNLFVQTKTPTYGYNVSGNWAGPANLFAAGGSVQDYASGLPADAYIIKRTNSKSVAVVSYGPAIASSYQACHTDAQGLAAAGIKVSYDDLDVPLGGSLTSAVQKIQQAGSDFIISCMQGSDNITMARAIQQYGLKVHQLWFDGYDNSLLDQYSSLMQGVYFNVNGTVPFDAVKLYPGKYPGVQQYIATMKKYAPSLVYSQEALQGYQSAALLAAGIKAAGANLTQANVISQTNKLTNFNSGGTGTTANWKFVHSSNTYPGCSAFVQVKGTTFVPALGKGSQVFVCFNKVVNLKNPATAPAPAGTPGA